MQVQVLPGPPIILSEEGTLTTPLSVLLLSDGRPGHFNLAEGILAAAGRMRPLAVHRIMARRGRWPGAVLATWSNSGKAAGPLLKIVYGLQPPDLPEAQLVVSAGAETLAANIACARLLGAANIFYGSLRRFRPESFDLVLTSYAGQCHRPRHAFALKPSPAANAARASRRAPPAKPPHRLALLIGGPSGESSWQDADWDRLQALVAGAASLGVSWRITNSRRTPAAVSDRFTALARSLPGSIDCFADVRRPDAPALAELIAESDAAIVTDNSSSMVSDAVAAGLAVVGLAPEQHRPTANEQSYRDHLAAQNWYRSRPLAALTPASLLDELQQLTPLADDPGDVLAQLLAARLPRLFGLTPAAGSRSWPPA